MHCGRSGQAKYGRIAARAAPTAFKRSFEIGKARNFQQRDKRTAPQGGRDFATPRPAKCPCGLLNFPSRRARAEAGPVPWVEGIMLAASLRASAAALALAALTLATPTAAATAPPPTAAAPQLSTDAILRWINDYRHKPDPDRLPALVRSLSALQAFKDPETSGAYVGFIAGVLGSNPPRAKRLLDDMLSIAPADRWILVRAIAYSGLPGWKDLMVSVGERMPERHAMINRYLEGKLPTLDQIAYPTAKPGMLDKIEIAIHIKRDSNAVALQPTPQLIDLLWGYYLATGTYMPVGKIIKLLPLAEDKDNVDNLTTGSAAKFTLASNAVRDLKLLAMLKASVKSAPQDTAKVLNDVIETAEDVDTGRMRRESLAAIEELKQKGPNSKREFTSMGTIGQGALSMGCIVAAATGQIEFGLPCVIGGAAYSAGMQYMSH
jgi:hypothetical protein